jgi:hypothetical protein
MPNRSQLDRRGGRASSKSCAECARLWAEYRELQKNFLKAGSERLRLFASGVDPRTEAEYQRIGELRREARKAISKHQALAHPPD